MSEAPTDRPLRRIAVAVDATEHSLQVISLAAAIAAALEAELEGVFVEDSELLRVVGLPFLREFRFTTCGEDLIDAGRLERELRAGARRVRASLEQSAARLGCRWSFRVWRGDVEGEILSAASQAEMFTLSPIGRFAPLRARPAATRDRPGDRALVVGVLFDGSAGALRALGAAGEFASRQRATLHVFLQGRDAATIAGLGDQAIGALGAGAERARLLPLIASDASGIIATVLGTGGDLFIIDADNPLLDRRTLWQRLAALQCPLLIVR